MPTQSDMATRPGLKTVSETLLEKATRPAKSPFEDLEHAVANYRYAAQANAPIPGFLLAKKSVTCH